MSAVEVGAVEVGWIGDTIEEPLAFLSTREVLYQRQARNPN